MKSHVLHCDLRELPTPNGKISVMCACSKQFNYKTGLVTALITWRRHIGTFMFNSFLAGGEFRPLLETFANSLYLDQDPNRLTF